MKQCSCCKEYKGEIEFYKTKINKSGLFSYCKNCQNQKARDYTKKYPEKRRLASKKWLENNREKYNEYQRKTRSTPEGKKRNKEKTARWIKNNPEKHKENCKKYYQKNHVPITPIIIKCELCGKEITTVQYHQKYCSICRKKINNKKKENGSRKKLQWKMLYTNPFDDTEKIDYHHINTTYVVPMPSDIHNCYAGYHTRDDNEDLDYIIEQIYPSFSLIKNSLRQS